MGFLYGWRTCDNGVGFKLKFNNFRYPYYRVGFFFEPTIEVFRDDVGHIEYGIVTSTLSLSLLIVYFDVEFYRYLTPEEMALDNDPSA